MHEAPVTLLALLVAGTALAAPKPPPPRTLYGDTPVRSAVVDDVRRGGFHLQIAFGLGGGPDSEGLHHAMELGGTLQNGVTLALLHTFVQNKGILRDKGGPDLIGGWLFEAKVPVARPEIVGKIAVGPGGLHDQSDGIRAIVGLGVAWGLDLHLPVTRRFGPTLEVTVFHAWVEGRGYVTGAVGLGFTLF